jgi:hypothetical protein
MSEQRVVYQTARGGNHSETHTALLKACEDYLRLHGAWTFRVHGHLGQRVGVPDLLACLPTIGGFWHVGRVGHLIAVEVKTGRGRLTAIQERERDALQQVYAVWVLVRRLEDLEDALLNAGLIAERAIVAGGRRS